MAGEYPQPIYHETQMIITQKPQRSFNQVVTAEPRTIPVPAATSLPVIRMIKNGKYEDAYAALRALPWSSQTVHAMGVCAMRSGRAGEAVRILAGLSLNPGTTVVRWDIDDTLLINYALALLLVGRPSGALEVLQGLKNRDASLALLIRAAISKWSAGLTFWRRLDWKVNRNDPPNCRVPIDFEAGVFPFSLDSVDSAEAQLQNMDPC